MDKPLLNFFIGLLITAGGIYNLHLEYTFIKNGIVVQGQVVGMQEHRSSRGTGSHRRSSITYKPQIAFLAQTGQHYTFEPSFSTSNPGVNVGDPVSLVYNRDNPNDAQLLLFRYTFGFGWVVTCVGGLLVLYTWGAMLGRRWLQGFIQSDESEQE